MSIRQLVRQIHQAPVRLVLATSGGGSRAISQLLEVPGASKTVLEALVPYSQAALAGWLGGPPDQACSARTARAMAMAAFCQALRLDGAGTPVAGVASTASLASDRPKRGPHRVHLALQTAELTATQSLGLRKQTRDRFQEERLVARLVLNLVAEACGVRRRLPLGLVPGEVIDKSRIVAPKPWQHLLLGQVEKIGHGVPPEPGDRETKAVFPGAFNPIHVGHRRMVDVAQRLLKVRVELELSILNVDKPPLDYWEMERRTGQFAPDEVVWLTRAARFDEKSRLFPGATFIVGTDTLQRIADPRYYADDPHACRAALEQIAARGCRFLVFGRSAGEGFLGLGDLDLPDPLSSISREVPADQFREDISSTEIRQSGRW